MMGRFVAAELRQFFRARTGSLLGAAVVGVLGAHFTALGAVEGAAHYLAFTYALFPTIFVALAAVSIAHERHTRFLDLVLVTPLTRTQYYWGKVVAAVLLGVIYLGLTVPFGLVFAWLAGWAWLPMIGYHLALGLVAVLASATLGVLVSVLFTHRGFLPALFTAFGVGILFASWRLPARVVLNLSRTPEEAAAWMQAFPVSPAFMVSAASPVLTEASRELRVLAPTVDAGALVGGSLLLSATYAVAGWWAFARLQNVDTWDAPKPAMAALAAGLVLAPGLVLGALPDMEPDPAQEPWTQRSREDNVREPSLAANFGGGDTATLRTTYQDPIRLTLPPLESAEGEGALYRNATLTLSSPEAANEFRFNRSLIPLGDVGAGEVTPAVNVTVVRAHAPYDPIGGLIGWRVTTDNHDWEGGLWVEIAQPTAAPYAYPAALTLAMVGAIALPRYLSRGWAS